MENPHRRKNEPTRSTGSLSDLLSHRSCDKSEDSYSAVFATVRKNRRAKRIEEAGNAFIKAAELAHSNRLESIKVVGRYEDAAKCFLQISDDRALACYMIAADILVKNVMSILITRERLKKESNVVYEGVMSAGRNWVT
ncbi:hypothetical protein RF11_11340 [Thelohanellus kitauei]|uniref:Uncharacterized protein n=1 Tax=Thelohanellus kitauei TaxID=669202 RepID=A0A0C2NLM4_THEKT|nr:hypothetical protein RF11_11340 [Thelohanellus kitauei]